MSRRRTLHGQVCTQSPRWVRGSVGFALGGLLGGLLGTAFAAYRITDEGSIFSPFETATLTRKWLFVAAGVTAVGATTGVIIGAHRPEC